MAERFGDYHLLKLIARGGMAEVYLATRQGIDRRIAIKRILPHMSDNQEFRTMFLDEARLVADLDHPNIVQVFDMGQVGNRLFMAMEFIDGASLKELLEEREELPIPLAAYIAAKVSLGLDYAHNRIDEHGNALDIIHRDISPQNIMLTTDGRVKIVDFGIAKAATNLYRTKAFSLKGKLKYMSPEQVRSDVPLDRRTDVFSTGVVIFEMLAGRPPHDAHSELELMTHIVHEDAPDPRELRSGIPEALVSIIAKALARDREQRYGNSRELQEALSRFMSRQGWRIHGQHLAKYLSGAELDLPRAPQATAHRATPLDGTGRGRGDRVEVKAPRKNLLAILGAAAGLLLLTVAITAFVLLKDQPTPAPKPAEAMMVDTAWAEKGARQRAEELRAEHKKAFEKHWQEGQRCAKESELWLASLQHLAAAEKLAKELKLEDAVRRDVIRLRAEIQRAYDKREEELAERRKEEEQQAALRREEEEKEAARFAAEEEAREKKERAKEAYVRLPPLKPEEAISPGDRKQSQKLRKKGETAHRTNRTKSARSLYLQALELNPRDYELYRLLGMAYSYESEGSKANTCFKRYVKLCPKCANAPTARKLIKAYNSLDP